MKLTERVYLNIKSIDFKLLAWTFFFMFIAGLLIFPTDSYGAIGEGIRFLFTPDFYEPVKSTAVESGSLLEQTSQNTMVTNARINIYQFLNVVKVILWLMTIGFVLAFLLKKPKTEEAQKSAAIVLSKKENEKEGVL